METLECLPTNRNATSTERSRLWNLRLCRGRAPEYLRLNPRVIEIVGEFCRSKTPIASICHGVQLLTATGKLSGRVVTAYPACGPEVVLAGATMREADGDRVVEDDNIISGSAWPSHPSVMNAFLKKLGFRIEYR